MDTSGGAIFDPEVVRERYLAERDKRLVPSREAIADLDTDPRLIGWRTDPFTPRRDRSPEAREVEVAILGAGIAGLSTGARLREAGVEDLCLIDAAGGVGGTWYWNRYPGVMCDVESYLYLPLLEEMGTTYVDLLLNHWPTSPGTCIRRLPTGLGSLKSAEEVRN